MCQCVIELQKAKVDYAVVSRLRERVVLGDLLLLSTNHVVVLTKETEGDTSRRGREIYSLRKFDRTIVV